MSCGFGVFDDVLKVPGNRGRSDRQMVEQTRKHTENFLNFDRYVKHSCEPAITMDDNPWSFPFLNLPSALGINIFLPAAR